MSFDDRKWRLNTLYKIIDKDGASIPFRMNKVQEDVFDNMHNRNLILKVRQLGMSSFAMLYLVDSILFTENLAAGIVSYSHDHAKYIFKKIIGHALEYLDPRIKPHCHIIQHSSQEITLNNGSSLYVGTTLRGSAYPLVLVTEFGKTCARDPLKAQEVITGTLQAVPKNGTVIIESTGEGNEGFFAEMVTNAFRRGNDNLTVLDYKLFFYNWLQDPTYILEDDSLKWDIALSDYFKEIEFTLKIKLTMGQKTWYASQFRLLGDKIKQEYPTTVSEAFFASSDAYYFAKHIEEAYSSNRCLYNSIYDCLLPVYVAMDIGLNDLTVIVFFQLAHGEVRIIDYYEDKNKDVQFYSKFLLQDKPYLYHTIFLPHDSKKRSILEVNDTFEKDFRRLFSHTPTKFHVLPAMDVQMSIAHSKTVLSRCVFNISKTKLFVDQICKYRKKWSEIQGRYLDKPQENTSEHYADAFRYTCQAVSHLETVSGMQGSLYKHELAVAMRSKRVC